MVRSASQQPPPPRPPRPRSASHIRPGTRANEVCDVIFPGDAGVGLDHDDVRQPHGLLDRGGPPVGPASQFMPRRPVARSRPVGAASIRSTGSPEAVSLLPTMAKESTKGTLGSRPGTAGGSVSKAARGSQNDEVGPALHEGGLPPARRSSPRPPFRYCGWAGNGRRSPPPTSDDRRRWPPRGQPWRRPAVFLQPLGQCEFCNATRFAQTCSSSRCRRRRPGIPHESGG